jgi:peptidoglycan/LPS O-acetylase OafA/YrhL
MFTHDYDHSLGGWKLSFLHDYGGHGVILFFAISGILITTRILEEEAVRGRVNLRGFYIRRLFRIQPAAVVYLAVAALVVPFGLTLDGGLKYWLGSLFFFRNYLPHDVGPFSYFATGHFWSLAVEEHFYLLLSLLLYFIRSRRVLIFAAIAAASWMLPLVLNARHLANPATAYRTTQENLHYLMVPAFLAVLLRHAHWRSLAVRYLFPGRIMLVFLAWVVLRSGRQALHGSLRGDLVLLCFLTILPLLVIATMLHPQCWTTRLLELKGVRFIGKISYSLYLWHVVTFIERMSPDANVANPTPHWFTHAPWNYLPAFACAILSFYLVERPMMRIGHRLAPPATPGRQDLGDVPAAASTLTAAGS